MNYPACLRGEFTDEHHCGADSRTWSGNAKEKKDLKQRGENRKGR